MKRRHEDRKVAYREWKKHRRIHVENNRRRNRVGVSAYVVDCECDEQVGRFRKTDAYDCGNRRCWICHGGKYPKRSLEAQEIKSQVSFREQLRELDEDYDRYACTAAL
jgi:hypothetical protein